MRRYEAACRQSPAGRNFEPVSLTYVPCNFLSFARGPKERHLPYMTYIFRFLLGETRKNVSINHFFAICLPFVIQSVTAITMYASLTSLSVREIRPIVNYYLTRTVYKITNCKETYYFIIVYIVIFESVTRAPDNTLHVQKSIDH